MPNGVFHSCNDCISQGEMTGRAMHSSILVTLIVIFSYCMSRLRFLVQAFAHLWKEFIIWSPGAFVSILVITYWNQSAHQTSEDGRPCDVRLHFPQKSLEESSHLQPNYVYWQQFHTVFSSTCSVEPRLIPARCPLSYPIMIPGKTKKK